MPRTILRAPVALLLLALGAGLASAAGVKVRAEFDKTFDFRGKRTWAWHPTGPGDVKMAVTPNDKPESVQARFEPIILDAVQRELEKRQLARAPAGATPHLYIHYYLLVSTSMSAQTMGQFLPAVPEWGIPPFTPATQSLRVFPQGSLLIDVSDAAANTIVWRGVAEGEIKLDRAPADRDARLRAAVSELLKKYPKTS
jgi:hypothetical protein